MKFKRIVVIVMGLGLGLYTAFFCNLLLLNRFFDAVPGPSDAVRPILFYGIWLVLSVGIIHTHDLINVRVFFASMSFGKRIGFLTIFSVFTVGVSLFGPFPLVFLEFIPVNFLLNSGVFLLGLIYFGLRLKTEEHLQ